MGLLIEFRLVHKMSEIDLNRCLSIQSVRKVRMCFLIFVVEWSKQIRLQLRWIWIHNCISFIFLSLFGLQRSLCLPKKRVTTNWPHLQKSCIPAIQRRHVQLKSDKARVAGLPWASDSGWARRHGDHPPEERSIQTLQHPSAWTEL